MFKPDESRLSVIHADDTATETWMTHSGILVVMHITVPNLAVAADLRYSEGKVLGCRRPDADVGLAFAGLMQENQKFSAPFLDSEWMEDSV